MLFAKHLDIKLKNENVLPAFAVGANDAANSWATSVGAGTVSLGWAYALGSLFETLGATFVSGFVIQNLGTAVTTGVQPLNRSSLLLAVEGIINIELYRGGPNVTQLLGAAAAEEATLGELRNISRTQLGQEKVLATHRTCRRVHVARAAGADAGRRVHAALLHLLAGGGCLPLAAGQRLPQHRGGAGRLHAGGARRPGGQLGAGGVGAGGVAGVAPAQPPHHRRVLHPPLPPRGQVHSRLSAFCSNLIIRLLF